MYNNRDIFPVDCHGMLLLRPQVSKMDQQDYFEYYLYSGCNLSDIFH